MSPWVLLFLKTPEPTLHKRSITITLIYLMFCCCFQCYTLHYPFILNIFGWFSYVKLEASAVRRKLFNGPNALETTKYLVRIKKHVFFYSVYSLIFSFIHNVINANIYLTWFSFCVKGWERKFLSGLQPGKRFGNVIQYTPDQNIRTS